MVEIKTLKSSIRYFLGVFSILTIRNGEKYQCDSSYQANSSISVYFSAV